MLIGRRAQSLETNFIAFKMLPPLLLLVVIMLGS